MAELSLKAERRLLFTLAAIQFIHITDFIIMMPLGPQFIRIFAITPTQFSFLVSAYTLSAAVFSLLAAFVLDRWDRKRTLLTVFAGFLASTFLCGISQTFLQLLISRIFAGAFGGTVGAVCLAIVGDVVPLERRGQAMGILMTAFSISTVFGLPLGLAVAAHAGWHWVFILLALAGSVLFFLARREVPVLVGHLEKVSASKWEEVTEILSTSSCLRGLALMALVMGAGFVIVPFLSPSLVANVGVAEAELSYIYLVGGICTFITSPLVGKLSDRWGHFTVFGWMALLSIVPFLVITNLSPIPLWSVLVFTTFFMVASGGRMVPAMAILSSIVPGEKRGSYMSLVTFTQQLSMGLASLLAGRIVVADSVGHLTHFERSGIVAVVFTLLALWVARRLKAVVQSGSGGKSTVSINTSHVRKVI